MHIPLLPSESREPNQIISITMSPDEQLLACFSGRNLVMKQQKINQLFVLKRVENSFEIWKQILVRDEPMFDKVCMQFHFRRKSPQTSVICVRKDCVFEYNYINKDSKVIYKLDETADGLQSQPDFFQINSQQTQMVIASAEDGIYLDITKKQEVDLDEKFQIGSIKEIIHDEDDGVFYILANKYEQKLGFFLIKMDAENPDQHRFLTKYKNKLDIGDCSIKVMRDHSFGFKELVISYKTIYINTYNVHVLDITQEGQPTIFRHESFQLWESESRGVLLKNACDFLKLSKNGAEILGLGRVPKRKVKDQ